MTDGRLDSDDDDDDDVGDGSDDGDDDDVGDWNNISGCTVFPRVNLRVVKNN